MPQLQPPKPKPQFPPIPEFYGGEVGPRVTNETATNQADWSGAYRKSVPPTKPIFDVLMEIANDPRNAWMGLGPVGMAVKGSRLIKPLVEAEQHAYKSHLLAKQKSLIHSGSEGAARILDYDPKLGHTTNPILGGPGQTAASIAPGGISPPPTADEIVAAQEILKKLAQQNAPKELTLYRGGEPLKHSQYSQMKPPFNPNTPIPATSSLNTATEFSQSGVGGKPSPLFEMKVPREDLLANIEKLQRGRGYRESEYLIPLRSFQGAQTRLPFPNPERFGGQYSTKFEGAQFKDIIEEGPWGKPGYQESFKYMPPAPPRTINDVRWTKGQDTGKIFGTQVSGYIEPLKDGTFIVVMPGSKLSAISAKTLDDAKKKLYDLNYNTTEFIQAKP